MICMSLDMICISKRAINFHPSILIKANDFVRQGRKTKKLTLLDQIILRFKLENMSVFRTDWYFNGPWRVNYHLRKKLLNTWASIDRIVCLEGNKSEVVLINVENKAF